MRGRSPDQPIPDAPDWLSADARGEWERVVPELAKRYRVDELDLALLTGYAETYATYRAAVRAVREQGLTHRTIGGVKLHPAAKLAAQSLAELRHLAGEFGLSPAARSRFTVERTPSAEEDLFDDFEKLPTWDVTHAECHSE